LLRNSIEDPVTGREAIKEGAVMAADTTQAWTGDGAIDDARVQEFAGRLMETFTHGIAGLIIDLAHRIGLLEALAAGPGTSGQLAERARLHERYVREILGALVTSRIVTHDPSSGTYVLPAEHAVCLTSRSPMNMAPLARLNTLLAKHVEGVEQACREGGGVPYDAFRPEFTEVMDGLSRGTLDGHLLQHILPSAGQLPFRLADGIRVADVGCGTGHAVNLMARAYPRSTFVGYDLAPDALGNARREAAELGLTNATFEMLDGTQVPVDPPFDAVFAFSTIHDLADPVTTLARIHRALVPGGAFVMVDIKASSRLHDNMDIPWAPWLYGVSTLHCMTVSLSQSGAGLGTVWGEQVAREMLADAGFVQIEVHDVPDDPFNAVYVARTPAS
jgi:SAM-dependent methyltransferase